MNGCEDSLDSSPDASAFAACNSYIALAAASEVGDEDEDEVSVKQHAKKGSCLIASEQK